MPSSLSRGNWANPATTGAGSGRGMMAPTTRMKPFGCDLGTRYSVRKSACRLATFYSPPSRRYTWVAGKVKLRG
jgi:hypothetical protein